MKSKVLVIILVLIIVALLIILGFKLFEKKPEASVREEAQPTEVQPTEVQPMTQEIWRPDDHSEEGKTIVRDHIEDIEGELAEMSWEQQEDEPLPDEQINRIHKFFEDRGFMCKHDGNPARREAIRTYLSRESENITRIKFELEYFISSEMTHNLKKPLSEQLPEDIHHVVQLGLKVSYIHEGNIIDPPGGRDDYHVQDCRWITP